LVWKIEFGKAPKLATFVYRSIFFYFMLSSPPRIEVYDDDGKQGRDNKDKLLGNQMPLFNVIFQYFLSG
jgi:hypothetical protein